MVTVWKKYIKITIVKPYLQQKRKEKHFKKKEGKKKGRQNVS